jgi:hypothetical protein
VTTFLYITAAVISVIIAIMCASQARFLLRTARRIEQPGSSLRQLPPEQLRKDYNDWAIKTWTAWRDSGTSYNTGGDHNEEICPGCYYASITSQAQYMAANHPDASARRRWSRSAEVDRRKFEALADCQCGKHLQPDLGAAEADLARYFPPR